MQSVVLPSGFVGVVIVTPALGSARYQSMAWQSHKPDLPICLVRRCGIAPAQEVSVVCVCQCLVVKFEEDIHT